MKEYVTLKDVLLIFWRIATTVACQAQTAIIADLKEKNFERMKMQNWLKNLFDLRERGLLTDEQCLQIQHDQLIMEQLGISSKVQETFDRCTLKTLSQTLFNYDGQKHKSDEAVCSPQFSDDTLKSLFYCYYLISAGHAADIYLNTALGMMLELRINSQNDGILYNGDPAIQFEMTNVQLVRGSVENSVYCTSTCALVNNNNDQQQHTTQCQSRGACWLLLTFRGPNGQMRQVHFDVAACAYLQVPFYGTSHPLPCHLGFFPDVIPSIRQEFDAKGWPMARLPEQIKTKQQHYLITKFDCLMPVKLHLDSINKIAKNFEQLSGEHRKVATLWNELQHAIQTKKTDKAVALYESLRLLVTPEQADFRAATFMRYVDARTEAVMMATFVNNLQSYAVILRKLSGVE